MRIFRTVALLVALSAAPMLGACSQSFENIPTNDIGIMLTPTGLDERIYTPGQIDIGVQDNTGRGNNLVLIQRSGFAVKEQFIKANRDSEDHRCLVGPTREPMAVDIRLVFALPNYETPDGKKNLARLVMLGNPKPMQGRSSRVLRLEAESVYVEQAQLQVRGKIRQICASYTGFDAAFNAFGVDGPDGFSGRIRVAVAGVLRDNNIPLHLVDAVVSNMKPDDTVMEAIAAKQAAEKRVQAIKVITDFLANDPDGSRKLVYRMQVLQEIVAKADEKGRSTIFMTDVSGNSGGNIIPVPQR